MKIKLVTHTPNPKKAIAAAFLNMGIGRDIQDLEKDITEDEAKDALKEIFKSHLDAPLEFCSFNLFWQDIPLFLRAQLVRHRVGWGFAERSMRFYDANLKSPVDDYDWDAMPTVTDKPFSHEWFNNRKIRDVVADEMKRQLFLYGKLLEEGVDQQEARNVIGVWYPTSMQTTCTYRALRGMLADRLSSQAHPFWRKAAQQIKQLVTEVDQQLGDGLIDSCEMAGRCVWRSKFDRDCTSCIKRGWEKPHEHQWILKTSFGENQQCPCGAMRQNLLSKGN